LSSEERHPAEPAASNPQTPLISVFIGAVISLLLIVRPISDQPLGATDSMVLSRQPIFGKLS
jgi:hypothetical protein